MIPLAILCILTTLITTSCTKEEKERVIHELLPTESLLVHASGVRYTDGKLNFFISIESNGFTYTRINNSVRTLGKSILEEVIFSQDPRNFVAVVSSNNLRYILFKGKILGNYNHFNDVFISKDKPLVLSRIYYSSDHEKTRIKILQKGEMKYISLPSGKELGPFSYVEPISQSIDGTNWWVVGKNPKGELTLVVNGKFVMESFEDIGIPFFSEDNFVTSVKKGNTYFITVNGKIIERPFRKIDFLTIRNSTWFSLGLSESGYEVIAGKVNNPKTYYRLFHTTNKIFWLGLDNRNIWLLEERNEKKYLLKNFRKLVGVYDEVYSSYLDSKHLMFVYRVDKKWFVRRGSTEYGPFDSVGEIVSIGRKVVFSFVSNGMNYVMVDNTRLGPYTRVVNISSKDDRTIIVFERNTKHYISIDDLVLGPYDEVFWNTFSCKNRRFVFAFREGDKVFINYSSEIFGPYKNVYMVALSDDGNTWGAGVMLSDNTLSLVINGENKGNYVNVDYESIKLDTSNARWGGITEKTNGVYLTTSYFEIGPFDRILQLKFSKDILQTKFSAETQSGIYVFFVRRNKIVRRLGPYEMAIFASDTFEDNVMVVMKNGKFFVFDGKKLLGPYDYIKEICTRDGKYYFVYGLRGKESVNVCGKDIISFEKIIKCEGILEGKGWYIVGFERGGKVFCSLGGAINVLDVYIPKETLQNDKIFFGIVRKNELQKLILGTNEIGFFSSIDTNSISYDYQSKTYAFIASRGREKFLVSNAGIYGPYKDIFKFRIIDEKNVVYAVTEDGKRDLVVNGKLVVSGIVDFDVDYRKEHISILLQKGSRVIIRTEKVVDLLHR